MVVMVVIVVVPEVWAELVNQKSIHITNTSCSSTSTFFLLAATDASDSPKNIIMIYTMGMDPVADILMLNRELYVYVECARL